MKKYLSIFLLLFSLVNTAAQQDSIELLQNDTIVRYESGSNGIWKNLKCDAGAIGGGFVNAFIQPVRWKKDDLLIAGGTIAGISLLYLADQQTSDFFTRQEEGIPQGFLDAGWVFGRPETSYGLTAGVYLVGLFTNNEKLRETGVLLITSAAATGFFQQTMKTITGRGRPELNKGKNQFRLFRGGHAYGSFPSGHTILSTTTVYALSKQFSNPWVKGGLYTLGLVTPLSRLIEGAHWLTDVALSVVVSVAIVEGVDKYLKNKKLYSNDQTENFGYHKDKKINWNLNIGFSGIGFRGIF